MIDCDLCFNLIGSKEEPIFVAVDDSVVCRECCMMIEGYYPDNSRAKFDKEDTDGTIRRH